MAASSLFSSATVCVFCAAEAQLDDLDRCEACVEAADRRAIALDELDVAINVALEYGVSPDQLRQAFEMVLAGQAGTIAGDVVAREVGATSAATIWRLEKPSSFLEDDRPNRLRDLRRASGYSVQALADVVGVDAETIAGWERDLRPDMIPPDEVTKLAELFGVTRQHLAGEDE